MSPLDLEVLPWFLEPFGWLLRNLFAVLEWNMLQLTVWFSSKMENRHGMQEAFGS